MSDHQPIAWYELSNPQEIDSPSLLLYQERIHHNIETLVGMVDNIDRLRPHVKTHKSHEITKLLLAAGIRKFKCATIAELEMLAQCHAKDILLAYQPMGPKQDRLIQLKNKYPDLKVACLVDHISIAQEINEKMSRHGKTLDIYFDVNVGMNRSGAKPSAIKELYESTRELQHLDIKGLHVYDGHFRQPNFAERKAKCDATFKLVEELLGSLNHRGNPLKVIAGGSPTFPIHASRAHVECSPGTFIYWDKGYSEKCAEQKFVPAALVMARIISLPDPSKLCIDLGHKSIASENPLGSRVSFLNAPNLAFVGHSEEHLVVEAGPDHTWQVGDILYGLPMHICPTVALYNEASLIVDRKVQAVWKTTARSRRLTI